MHPPLHVPTHTQEERDTLSWTLAYTDAEKTSLHRRLSRANFLVKQMQQYLQQQGTTPGRAGDPNTRNRVYSKNIFADSDSEYVHFDSTKKASVESKSRMDESEPAEIDHTTSSESDQNDSTHADSNHAGTLQGNHITRTQTGAEAPASRHANTDSNSNSNDLNSKNSTNPSAGVWAHFLELFDRCLLEDDFENAHGGYGVHSICNNTSSMSHSSAKACRDLPGNSGRDLAGIRRADGEFARLIARIGELSEMNRIYLISLRVAERNVDNLAEANR
jgi:hypothetical protein